MNKENERGSSNQIRRNLNDTRRRLDNTDKYLVERQLVFGERIEFCIPCFDSLELQIRKHPHHRPKDKPRRFKIRDIQLRKQFDIRMRKVPMTQYTFLASDQGKWILRITPLCL